MLLSFFSVLEGDVDDSFHIHQDQSFQKDFNKKSCVARPEEMV